VQNLELEFTSRTGGHSLARLYSAVTSSPILLFIKTMKNERFGAYISHSWVDRKPKRYFGNGESFLFKLDAEPKMFPWVGLKSRKTENDDSSSTAAPGDNHPTPDFFVLAEQNSLIVGGAKYLLLLLLLPLPLPLLF